MLGKASLGTLLALGLTAVPVLGPGPVWDWQTTFLYDFQGEVTSAAIDFAGDQWLECSDSPALILSEEDTTQEEGTGVTNRLDTNSGIFERERWEGGLVTVEQWSCDASQSQIPEPNSGSEFECTINVEELETACLFVCGLGGFTNAEIPLGALWAVLRADCLASSTGRVDCPINDIIGDCSARTALTPPQASFPYGTCELLDGIAINARCWWSAS